MSEASSKTTTDLKVIQKWAEEREGKPTRVKGTGDNDGAGVLRIDFPGFSGDDKLEEISWEEWYQTFQDRGLEFLYQEHTAGGEESRFFRFLNIEKEEEKAKEKENEKEKKHKEDVKAKEKKDKEKDKEKKGKEKKK